MSWVGTLQLIRTVSNISTHRDFPTMMDFDGFGLCFVLTGVAVYMESFSLNGTSIMASVMLRPGVY